MLLQPVSAIAARAAKIKGVEPEKVRRKHSRFVMNATLKQASVEINLAIICGCELKCRSQLPLSKRGRLKLPGSSRMLIIIPKTFLQRHHRLAIHVPHHNFEL